MNNWIHNFERCKRLFPFMNNVNMGIDSRVIATLRFSRNPEWGLPDMDVLRQLAYTNGMRLERIVSSIL